MKSRKNILKKFRIEKIKSEHAPAGPHDVVMVLDGLKTTYNVGKIFRSAQAFGVREVCLVNMPFFDPYPAKGAFKQTRSRSFSDFKECYEALSQEGYVFCCLEAGAAGILGEEALPQKLAFVVGHEEFGFSFKKEDFEGLRSLQIRQWGWVESLNVSVAASLALYEYTRSWGRPELAQKSVKHLDPVAEGV